MQETEYHQLSFEDLGLWSGKTYQEHSARETEKTSKRSSKKPSRSQSRKSPLCLCLRKDGPTQDSSTMKWGGGQLLGEYTMHATGEYPNEEEESLLSQILLDSVPEKYSLSGKACAGILRRAKERNRSLPDEIVIALKQRIAEEDTTTVTPTTVESQDRQTPQTQSPADTERGGNNTPLVVNTYDVRFTSSGTKNARGNCHETDHCRCLDTGGQDPDSNHGGLVITEAYGVQRSMGGVEARKEQNGGNGTGYSDESVGTLNTIDRHAVVSNIGSETYASLNCCDLVKQHNNQTNSNPEEHFVFQKQEESEKPTYSLGHYYYFTKARKEEIDTLAASDFRDPQRVIEPGEVKYKARRITPVECERLQDFPDNWTDIGEWIDSKGKKRQSTDAMRYKALGNSIALPYWKVLARRIAAQYDRDITMGSLFDGISGFILAFMHAGAKCLWTAEIEPFCRAVCKYHFGGEDAEVEDGTH